MPKDFGLMEMRVLVDVGIVGFSLFVVSVLVFVMTPGLDTMLVLGQTLKHGKGIGMASVLGVTLGVLVHTVLAAVGLAAVIAKSAVLFAVIKYLGAAYLVYLGATSIYHALKRGDLHAHLALQSSASMHPLQALRSGLMTNVLNPKVALFFLAFFPQFIDPVVSTHALPYLVLGVLYAVISLVWLLLVVQVSGSVFVSVFTKDNVKRGMDMGAGVVFCAMGVKVAME